jgi:hypothetical protein
MDWLTKIKNPFLATLTAVALLAGLAAAYFAFSAQSEFAAQEEEYRANNDLLQTLQSAGPFPSEENAVLAEKEAESARQLLEQISSVISSQTAPYDPALTPQLFQDQLSEASEALQEAASKNGMALPSDFYLGFEQYRAAPPPAVAAPELGQQLQVVRNVLLLLASSRVSSVDAVKRELLVGEGPASSGKDSESQTDAEALKLAQFDIEFSSDQAAFREALGAIVAAEPAVFLRLLAVSNSQPVGPTKENAGESPSDSLSDSPPDTESPSGVPVVFGQESVAVKMRLAAVSGAPKNAADPAP